MPKIQTVATKVIHFLQTEIWRLSKSDLSRSQVVFLKPLRIVLLTIQGYVRDNCALRASALTFYSLLSIVPVMAMAFGMAKGFGLEQRLERQLYLRFEGQEEMLAKIIDFARTLLENTKGGIIAGIGVLVLFWSTVKVLGHIESALNQIWKVRARSYIRRLTDYLAVMVVSPLVVIVSSSVNVYITTQVTVMTSKLALLRMASPLIFFLLKLLPYGLIWLLFILIYMVMPNTRVRFRSALIAGVISGTIYQLSQGLYLHAQIVVAKYNAIYGSFAALPLFLIWLQLSWMIVLFGAQIAYAHQHVDPYAMVFDYQNASPAFQKQYALQILKVIIDKFHGGDPAPTADHIAETQRLPLPLVEQLIDQLVESDLVSPVSTAAPDTVAYQPARDIHTVSIATVMEAWDRRGQNDLPVEPNPAFTPISQALASIRSETARSAANRLVKDI